MSYVSLGQLGSIVAPTGATPWLSLSRVPGTAEIATAQSELKAALGGRVGLLECWKAKTLPNAQAKAWVDKYNSLKNLYPVAMAAAKFSPCAAGNTEGYRPWTMEEWWDKLYSSQVTKIDMTPAVNTVADGTPGSWNVSGTQMSGALYSYNFADKAAAQAYAQAVVDSGGTATMYQVPVAATPPSSMPAPVTGGTVGSGQYEVKGVVSTGAPIDKFFTDYTSANNFAVSVNSAGGNVQIIDTSTGQIATPLPQNSVVTPVQVAPPANATPAASQVPIYVPPAPSYNYGSSAPSGYTAPAQTPDQMYVDPNIPAQVAAPAPVAQADSGSGFGMLALIAVPVGAYLYFKHK